MHAPTHNNTVRPHHITHFMSNKPQGLAYARDPQTKGHNAPYEQKFAGFIDTIAKARAMGATFIFIAEPWVIGDTHEELIESLSRLAGTKIALHIVSRSAKPHYN